MKNVPQTFSVVIANAEKMYLYICKRQAFVFHKRQPLDFPSLTHQEAVTAWQASRVLQFKQQMAKDSEELKSSSLTLLNTYSEQGMESLTSPN